MNIKDRPFRFVFLVSAMVLVVTVAVMAIAQFGFGLILYWVSPIAAIALIGYVVGGIFALFEWLMVEDL